MFSLPFVRPLSAALHKITGVHPVLESEYYAGNI